MKSSLLSKQQFQSAWTKTYRKSIYTFYRGPDPLQADVFGLEWAAQTRP
jgi:hypothetical protein